MKSFVIKYISVIFTFSLLMSCASYHDIALDYQQQIQRENYQAAYNKIEKSKYLKKERNELLSYLEKGKLAFLQKDYKLSNTFFNKADFLIEDQKKNFGRQVLGVVTNPEKENYKAEDFEKVAIHYYKALNYIFLNQMDEALVEAKRINLRLQAINDQYPEGKKNRYTSDAFALNLQGLLYEATGNINDAFISYRNAVELYLANKGAYFGVYIPNQLKQDVINAAHQLGFKNEEAHYAKLFNLKYNPELVTNNSLVVFWENGMVPYKSQTYFTFTSLPGSNGFMTITNEDLGVNIPIPTSKTRTNKTSFSDISVLNIAFPKYQDRKPFYNKAELIINGAVDSIVKMELVEDYNVIAKQTLKDRTVREIGKIALRVATKKITENVISDQNANLGALVGIFNAFTEKTDTRNWQTLPSRIFYARVPVTNSTTKVVLKASNSRGGVTQKELNINTQSRINFLTYNSLQIIEPN